MHPSPEQEQGSPCAETHWQHVSLAHTLETPQKCWAHPVTAHLWIKKFPQYTWKKTKEVPDGMTAHPGWWQDTFPKLIDRRSLLPGQRMLKMFLSARGSGWSGIEGLRIEREVIYALFHVSILWEKCREQQHERFLKEKRHKGKLGDR